MSQASPTAPFTYRDLRALPDDDLRHEILDGVHYVTASPVPRHQRILMRLATLLADHLREQPLGEVFPGPLDLVLSETNVLAPDLLFVSLERSGIVTDRELRGAPDLVVEILSPSTRGRDRGVKRRIYERSGVREYWIVDPVAETIELFRPRAGKLVLAAELSHAAPAPLTTPLLPGLELPLEALFG